MGLFLAIIIILQIVESFFPPIGPLGNVKIGLSNIITMYTLFFLGIKEALILAVLKSLFSFLFLGRGIMAFTLSLTGGMASLGIIILLSCIFKDKISYIILSIFGAIFHNIGQITALSIIINSWEFFYSLPLFIIFGVIMGSITGISLKYIMPALENISKNI